MALDVVSPRISFSHDLEQNGVVGSRPRPRPTPADPTRPSSIDVDIDIDSIPSDFNFCVSRTIAFQELSTADEIFSGGKLLPLPVVDLRKKPAVAPSQSLPTEAAGSLKNARKKFKEFLSTTTPSDADENEEKPPPPEPTTRPSNGKWFWQFGRSASLNCCDSKRGRGMVRALHFLSRSKSAPSQKRRDQSRRSRHQKPPLKKSGRPPGGGVQVSPVLNLPPQCISRATVGLVGLGSLLCNGSGRGKKENNEHSQIK